MHLARKYAVPGGLARLYDFLNSVDERRYREHGVQHAPHDELATRAGLESWMRARGLLGRSARLDDATHGRALALRGALRAFLQHDPGERAETARAIAGINAAAAGFPLLVQVAVDGTVGLRPAPGASALGEILGELLTLAQLGELDRLKICASEECRWAFYDRSKPGNRRWCSSARCGNRQKTRSYRERRREATEAGRASR